MKDRHFNRILVHITAVMSAFACWWLLMNFAAALLASLTTFLVINAIGHLTFGPMPTAEDLRRDVARMLRQRQD